MARIELANPVSAKPPDTIKRLTLLSKLGFGIGDFGLNLYWQPINLVLFYFYTDIFNISAQWAGNIFFLASIWDGAADPLFAIVADRTTSRWGSYRPYLLFGSVPLALCLVLVFSNPGLSGGALIAYALVTHMALRTAYTVLNIPYSALSARMTANADDRTSMVGYRMQFAFLGAITVTFLLPILVRVLGQGDVGAGYRYTAATIGGLSILIFALCFLGTAEEIGGPGPGRSELTGSLKGLAGDALAFLRFARRSRPLVQVLAAIAFFTIGMTFINKNIVYLFKYQLGQIDTLQYILPMTALATLVSIAGWVRVIQRWGKRNAWVAGSAIMVTGLLCLYETAGGDLILSLVLLAVIFAGSGAHAVCIWSLLPDVVDYHGARFGRRDEAKVFGLSSFLQKIAVGTGAMLLGVVLERIGLVANAPQTQATLQGLRAVMCLPPIACLGLSVAALWSLPLKR